MVTYAKISPKSGEPQRYSWGTKKNPKKTLWCDSAVKKPCGVSGDQNPGQVTWWQDQLVMVGRWELERGAFTSLIWFNCEKNLWGKWGSKPRWGHQVTEMVVAGSVSHGGQARELERVHSHHWYDSTVKKTHLIKTQVRSPGHWDGGGRIS